MIRIFISLGLIFIFSCNSAIKNEHVNMDVLQFSNLIDTENYTLLDVRTKEERIPTTIPARIVKSSMV